MTELQYLIDFAGFSANLNSLETATISNEVAHLTVSTPARQVEPGNSDGPVDGMLLAGNKAQRSEPFRRGICRSRELCEMGSRYRSMNSINRRTWS
jgi:hypothetical protein